MEQVHQRMMRGFWIGNQMVWCCRGCNPAPEALLIPTVKAMIEELGQPRLVDSTTRACLYDMTGIVVLPVSSILVFVVSGPLDDILLKCYQMEEQRLIACAFLGKFGVWFWRWVLSVYRYVLLIIVSLGQCMVCQ